MEREEPVTMAVLPERGSDVLMMVVVSGVGEGRRMRMRVIECLTTDDELLPDRNSSPGLCTHSDLRVGDPKRKYCVVHRSEMGRGAMRNGLIVGANITRRRGTAPPSTEFMWG